MKTWLFMAPILFSAFTGVFAQTPANSPDIRVLPSRLHETRPRIAVDWTSGSTLMMVMSAVSGTGVTSPCLFSTDGGRGWLGEQDNPPGVAAALGGTVCFFDASGRAYYVTLGSPGGITILSTVDLGAVWTLPANADALNSANNDALYAASDPSGVHPANAYVGWTDFGVNNSPVQFSRSTNEGVTWGGRVTLAIGSSLAQGAFISTGPAGEVYVVWAHYNGQVMPETGVGFARSTDGGATFSSPVIAFPISGIRVSSAGIPAFNNTRANSFPEVDVDRSNGVRRGWVYVSYADRSQGQANVYIRRSTDEGSSWSDSIRVSGLPVSSDKQQWAPSLAVDRQTGNITVTYCGMDSAGTNFMTDTYAAHSTNGGYTWTRWVISDTRWLLENRSTPGGIVTTNSHTSTAALGGMAWSSWSDARTDTFQVWVERIDYTAVSAGGRHEAFPAAPALEQNMPNPFNPSTIIRFSLPGRQHATLKIYDLLGREVTTLVDEEMGPGMHDRTFSGSGLASGVYVYRLQAGPFVEARKLVLLR